jgi:hypothetical protein
MYRKALVDSWYVFFPFTSVIPGQKDIFHAFGGMSVYISDSSLLVITFQFGEEGEM